MFYIPFGLHDGMLNVLNWAATVKMDEIVRLIKE